MLQQTTVAAVVPYYERFTAAFPNVQALAAANVDDVLRLWEGLGYYSRARNLHKAAQVIVLEHNGRLPEDPSALQSLPGIGRYTAGAIASFAFGMPAAIVEANTERLYSRLIALQDDVRTTASQRLLWQFAESIVPSNRPGDFNQSLMDIGARICRPKDPDCEHCPLSNFCNAFQQNLQHELPQRKPATVITAISEAGVVLHRKGQYLLRRRTETERWAGMWDFVRFEIDPDIIPRLPFSVPQRRSSKASRNIQPLFSASGEAMPEELQSQVLHQAGCRAGVVLASIEFQYSVTRYRVRLMCFLCHADGARRTKNSDVQWFNSQQLTTLPLSKTGRVIAEWLSGIDVP
jgi:A/G-specific adenine glycosylase